MPDTANDIDALASEWATRVAEGTLNPSDAAHLEQWLCADTRHRGAFVRAQAGWRMVSRIARTQGLAGEPEPTPARPAPRRRFTPPRLIGAAIAAGLVAAVTLGLTLGDRPRDYRSGVGEVRSIVLEDGSTATIGSGSALEVAMHADARALRLDAGEAWFDVAHNRARPFVVAAGDIRVRAVGTAFAVCRTANGIDVLVSDGTVEVRRGDAGPAERVSAGQTLHIPARATAPAIRATPGLDAVDRQLGWRQGLIILDGEPLASAAARFNRYNRVQIAIEDPALAAIRLTGRFKSSEALAFAQAAGKVAHARVVQREDRILLSR